MPFHSDPRAGYFHMNFNMSWWDMAMEDYRQIRETEMGVLEFKEPWREQVFDQYIEDCVQQFVRARVFQHDPENILAYYETVWEYMYEMTMEWVGKHPDMAFWNTEELD